VRQGHVSKDDVSKQVDAYRRTIVQISGGIVVAIGLYLTWRRILVTEEGQITDRFTAAIKQLGDSKTVVQLGGVYALERIAEDSPRNDDHSTVMETLAAFIRENAPINPNRSSEEQKAFDKVRGVVEAACRVLGRRTRRSEEPCIDLSNTDLSNISFDPGAYLARASFRNAKLHRVRLEDAHLDSADLEDTDLSKAYLWGADLRGAHAESANFNEALLGNARLDRSNLGFSVFDQCNLKGSIFEAADLSYAQLENAKDLTADQLCSAESLEGAELSPDLKGQVVQRCRDLFNGTA
jgi:uncharacterized protein YjbI with pentapeptide repeats